MFGVCGIFSSYFERGFSLTTKDLSKITIVLYKLNNLEDIKVKRVFC